MAEGQLIGVVGAGTMGAGIAHTLAEHGYDVAVMDTDPVLVRKALASLKQRLDDRVARGRLSAFQRDETMQRLRVADGPSALRDAEFVIEAVVEDAAAKRRLFEELERVCMPQAILATNTSSLSITRMADGLKHPGRFIGMHFFNPAPVMPLVEVIGGEKTDNQAVVQTVALARALEKTPVRHAKDRPGFIANRVARPFYLESLALLERGVADVATIDDAVRTAGFPMGPFELLDLIGLDVNLAVTRTVYDGFQMPARFAPNAIQEKLVADSRLGRKTRRGFYDHSNGPATPAFEVPVRGAPSGALSSAAFKAFAEAVDRMPDLSAWIYSRIITAVMNEGAVAAGDGTARARDIDLSMTLGLRYPEGPLGMADRIGLDLVLDVMTAFDADDPSGRHKPAPPLIEHVRKGELGEKTAAGFLWHSL